jgi:hypothetical protein
MKTKIKRHTKVTYETTDGNTFIRFKDAIEWQTVLDSIDDVTMLTSKFKKTDQIDKCFYVKIENENQLKAFNNLSVSLGYDTDKLPSVGYFMYEDDRYYNIDDKIQELQDYKNKLDTVTNVTED